MIVEWLHSFGDALSLSPVSVELLRTALLHRRRSRSLQSTAAEYSHAAHTVTGCRHRSVLHRPVLVVTRCPAAPGLHTYTVCLYTNIYTLCLHVCASLLSSPARPPLSPSSTRPSLVR